MAYRPQLPYGVWITLMVYVKVGDANTGRYRVTAQPDGGAEVTVADHKGWTAHPDFKQIKPITYFNPHKLYTHVQNVDIIREAGGLMQIYYDDFELWLGGPIPAKNNKAPQVSAGLDLAVTLPAKANLKGSVTDDGLPKGTLTNTWSKLSGPGNVTIANTASLETTASFSTAGIYVLRLNASDGALTASDDLTVTVSTDSIPPQVSTRTVVLRGKIDGADGVKSFLANGKPLQVANDGSWTLTIEQVATDSSVKLELECFSGQRTSRTVVVKP